MKLFDVSLNETTAARPSDFASFNAFFTRTLKPGARPICQQVGTLVSPCDGSISQAGAIKEGRLLQVKGLDYSLSALLASEIIAPFAKGHFATLYLSPKDYHRVHAPFDCKLVETRYIRGRLFSVQPKVQARVPALFARNERLVMLYECAFGQMGVVMVGAKLVSGIHSRWRPEGYAHNGPAILTESFVEQPKAFAKGEEIGHFAFGSTVILLLPEAVRLVKDQLQSGAPILHGQAVGQTLDVS